jgi:hypothetical protein
MLVSHVTLNWRLFMAEDSTLLICANILAVRWASFVCWCSKLIIWLRWDWCWAVKGKENSDGIVRRLKDTTPLWYSPRLATVPLIPAKYCAVDLFPLLPIVSGICRMSNWIDLSSPPLGPLLHRCCWISQLGWWKASSYWRSIASPGLVLNGKEIMKLSQAIPSIRNHGKGENPGNSRAKFWYVD